MKDLCGLRFFALLRMTTKINKSSLLYLIFPYKVKKRAHKGAHTILCNNWTILVLFAFAAVLFVSKVSRSLPAQDTYAHLSRS